MDYKPIQRGANIFLVASCFGNRDTKLRPDGLLSSSIDFFSGRKDASQQRTKHHINRQFAIRLFSYKPSSSYPSQRDCKQRRYLVASPVACMGYALSNFAKKNRRLFAVFHIDDHIPKGCVCLFVCFFACRANGSHTKYHGVSKSSPCNTTHQNSCRGSGTKVQYQCTPRQTSLITA